MATRRFHANLTSSQFPHNFRELSSTVVQATPFENNRQIGGGFSGGDAEQSLGVCQAYYVSNVLPTARGYASIVFSEAFSAPTLAVDEIVVDAFSVRGEDGQLYWCVQTNLQFHLYNNDTASWTTQVFPSIAHEAAYKATVKGRSFFFVRDIATVYEFDFGTGTWGSVAISGLNLADIYGICGVGPYIVAWTLDTVFWSSNVDPTEFDPGIDVTAGSTSILGVRGSITQCVALGDNFVVYTAVNAVAAKATANTLNPFVFNEINQAGGAVRQRHISLGGSIGGHVIWTASGFQSVSLDSADYTFMDFSDGLIRKILTRTHASGYAMLSNFDDIDVQITFASNRWLCFSVFVEGLQYADEAFVYDISLKRWGRVVLPHLKMLEYVQPSRFIRYNYTDLAAEFPAYSDMSAIVYSYFDPYVEYATPSPGENLAAVLQDGTIISMQPWTEALPDGFVDERDAIGAELPSLHLGRFKVYRTQGAKLQNIRGIGLTADTTVLAVGHNQAAEIVTPVTTMVALARQPGTFYGRVNADSFTVIIQDNFVLTDLTLEATEAGMRNQRFATGD